MYSVYCALFLLFTNKIYYPEGRRVSEKLLQRRNILIFSKGLTRFGLVAAVAALMLTLSVAVAGTANTQMLPATFYGKGLKVGDKVEVSIGGAVCGIATATVAGEWSLQVAADNTCKPTINAAVVLKLNGVVVNAVPVAEWARGGLPTDVANG